MTNAGPVLWKIRGDSARHRLRDAVMTSTASLFVVASPSYTFGGLS